MKYFASIALLIALAACVAAPKKLPISSGATQSSSAFSILDIIDGDTIKISSENTGNIVNARLVGYDTPETFRAQCVQEKALGEAATSRLQLLLAQAGSIEPKTMGIDKYGRVLLHLTLDGKNVAKTMIAEGFAVPYSGGGRIDWCKKLGAT